MLSTLDYTYASLCVSDDDNEKVIYNGTSSRQRRRRYTSSRSVSRSAGRSVSKRDDVKFGSVLTLLIASFCDGTDAREKDFVAAGPAKGSVYCIRS